MPQCARNGCGQEYDAAQNTSTSCSYHLGGPVFHEGLKSWSCCNTVNKPVLDFDEFMKLPGCTAGSHTEEAAKPPPAVTPRKPAANVTVTEVEPGKEVFTTVGAKPSAFSASPKNAPPPVEPAPVIVEDEDDTSIPVAVGTICRRTGCGAEFVSDEVNRVGDGEDTVCTYHPAPPIFHEGSKGYLCCKPRVLEFDQFLKIPGCKTGRHVFAPKRKLNAPSEELTDCRVDHYQTPQEVHVTVFAKQADKEKSLVKVEESQIHFDLFLPNSKRFKKTITLFGPVDPEVSSHKFYGTKVEVVLKKLDNRSWTVLERTTHDLGNISLTFGVGGRTGTIGAKNVVLDDQNKTRVTS